MALVRLFMAARRAASTRSAASSCIPAAHRHALWLFQVPAVPVLKSAGRSLRNLGMGVSQLEASRPGGGIRNCTGLKING